MVCNGMYVMEWNGMVWNGMKWYGMVWNDMYVCTNVCNVYMYVCNVM